MSYPYSTLQAGSGVIGSASGNTVIVADVDADRFGIGANLIIWPAGQSLDREIRNYETMLIDDKTGSTLTVIRGSEDDPTGLDTWAAGDQIALSFPTPRIPANSQTQVLTVGRAGGDGPTIDLGPDTLGVVGRITTVISDVNLDGGTGDFELDVICQSSFDGTNWGSSVTGPSGIYSNPAVFTIADFTSPSDPTPLYGKGLTARYIRFHVEWLSPLDLGVNASATINIEMNYY